MDNIIGLISANYKTPELGELTSERTIASLPFGSRYRLIDFPLSNMVNSGISTVGIITPYKYRSIIDHIGAGSDWSLDRRNGGLCILPGSVYGISSTNARFLLRDISNSVVYLNRSPAPYVVISGANTVYNMNYRELVQTHIDSGADITMAYTIASEDDNHLTGIKAENGKVVSLTQGVSAGQYQFIDTFVISRSLLLKIIEWYAAIDYLDFFDVIADDFEKMDVRTYKFDGYAKTIFSTKDYFRRSMDLLNPEILSELFTDGELIRTKIQDTAPSKYTATAKVRNSLIPAGCVVEGTVENSILFRGVNVGKNVVIRNSIIMQACVVEEGAVIENAIIDRSNVIAAGTVIKGSAENAFVQEKA
jgi:glucose-1-phosphate adenylyltransferase